MPMIGSGFGADVDGGSLLLGGAVGYDTGGPLSVEGEANALWHFGASEEWRPYASIGAGVRHAEVDFDEVFGPGFDEGSTEA